MIERRAFITGLVSFAVAAPAIVRAGSLMPVKVMRGLSAGELLNQVLHRLGQLEQWQTVWQGDWKAIETYMVDYEVKHRSISLEEYYDLQRC